MGYIVTHDSVDVTEHVNINDFDINKNLYDRADIFSFSVIKKTGVGFTPVGNKSISVVDGATTIFAGRVLEIEQDTINTETIRYNVICKSHEHELDQKIVIERKENMTVEAVITSLFDVYAPTFTYTNVSATGILVDTVLFNRIPLTKCLDKLAKLTNYIWWIDEAKDLHFLAQPSVDAPFSITDNDGNYIQKSLKLKLDFSQLRNVVTVQGGNQVGNQRVSTLSGNGTKSEFLVPYVYDKLPTVKVGAVTKTVGVDFIQPEEDYQVMWSRAGKYIRFTTGNIPPSGIDNIEINGNPLFPIFIQKSDAVSVTANGTFEFFVKDRNIRSRAEAILRADVELEAYASNIFESSFQTYTAGLKVGQTILINSTIHGVNENFRINSIKIRAINKDQLLYTVKLATIKTLGIIEALQRQLFGEELDEGEDETLLSFTALNDTLASADSSPTTNKTSPPYKYDDANAKWNFATWS